MESVVDTQTKQNDKQHRSHRVQNTYLKIGEAKCPCQTYLQGDSYHHDRHRHSNQMTPDRVLCQLLPPLSVHVQLLESDTHLPHKNDTPESVAKPIQAALPDTLKFIQVTI